MFRNESQDGGVRSQNSKNRDQHEKGIQNRDNAQDISTICPCHNNTGNQTDPCSDYPGSQGPGRAGEDFGKFLVGNEVMEFSSYKCNQN